MPSTQEQATAYYREPAVALSEVAARVRRIDYIDVARGFLVLLMFVVHAATPCMPSIRDPIQRLWILEIATTGFAMMAGYTVGIRYDADVTLPQPRRLWKRCGELLVVMFWSNALLGLAKLYVMQPMDAAVLIPWFLGLFTFHTEYNISGVLFPIALMLPILPMIYATEKRTGIVAGLGWFTAFVVLIVLLGQLKMEHAGLAHIRKVLLAGLGGFSVLAFMAYGILGYVNARVGQAFVKKDWPFGAVVTAGIVLSSGLFALLGSLAPEGVSTAIPGRLAQVLLPFARSEVMFLGVMALSGVLAALWSGSFLIEPLRQLGTYALFAFVFHRFVGQGLITAFHLQGGEWGTFLLVLAAIAGSTYLLCAARQSYIGLDAGLKRLFL